MINSVEMKATKCATKDEIPTENTTTPPSDGYMVKSELATRLRNTPRTVERWMRLGIIPYIKIGKGRRATVLFRWPDVEARLKAKFGVGIDN
jgi:hypothetical protein